MKVVLFCGGQGTRLREYSETIPKPMVRIGYRPILWNIMRYYAHYGYNDFVLALGYKGDFIKDYFINYDETISNNFVFQKGGEDVELLNSDIHDWKITFVDTGMHSNIGQRLMRVKDFLGDDEMFLANYADGLSDIPLDVAIQNFKNQPDKVASLTAYQPTGSFHLVSGDDSGLVTSIHPMSITNLWLNVGFFIFRKEIFDYINEGEELVMEPFQRLIQQQRLIKYHHEGFWRCMDTFKDKMELDKMVSEGRTMWEVWNNNSNSSYKKVG